MAIDFDEATEYLAFHLEWDSEPKLSDAKQDRLLRYARAVDVNGISPDGTGYVETYTYDSLKVARAIGARWKAIAAAELHQGDESKVFDHWNTLAEKWEAEVAGMTIGGTQVSSDSGSFALPNVAVF